ncbi:hypothetical protein SAMN05421734_103142 [Pelagirhabdus alkalitolerans]|uniref:Type IV pilus assembly protein PilN n=1 Tax=Pelagirhabdus alkalitolerans TaxID=1612202 RepID=A0A1G6HNW2_9BACI|nr:PilN domain-containing protein [Pelagirhabdus alkalitolerans]SDB95833.1 hypothetical protein SAMN05421734_103142 [Pelagirhabdus alkalitolerans]
MRDFNFFRPFITSRIKKSGKGEWVALGFFIILVFIIAIPWYMSNELRSLNDEVEQLNTEVNDPSLQEDIDHVRVLQSELSDLRTETEQLDYAISMLGESEAVTEQLLTDLAQAKSDDILFEQISVNNRTITINGFGASRVAIANLEYNIRGFDRYEDLFVPSITYDDEDYEFSLEFTIKGGEEHEELEEPEGNELSE